MSPGLIARPSGRFSVAPTTASSFTGSRRRAIAATASTTAAPPDMSNFISAIFGPGFSEMPPLSNVTALPTKPSNGPFASAPSYLQDDQRGLLLGALRDGGEGAHAEPLDARASLHLDLQPLDLLAERPRVVGERRRGEVVAGPVLQVARRVDRRGDDRGVGDRRLDSVRRRRRSGCRGAWAWRPRSGRPPARTCADRSCSRRGSCPPRAPPRPRRSRRLTCAWSAGTSQHSTRVESSRARSRASAAATRARSGVKSLRAPSPTVSQRLPSAWVSASALNERCASPLASSSPTGSGTRPTASARGSSPSNRPTTMVSASVASGGSAVQETFTISAQYPSRRGMRLLALPVCSPFHPT